MRFEVDSSIPVVMIAIPVLLRSGLAGDQSLKLLHSNKLYGTLTKV